MPTLRLYELADELGLGRQELLAKIRQLDIGFEVANPMSRLTGAEVQQVKVALGYASAPSSPLEGVWRLESVTHRGNSVITGQTHLAVTRDRIWEVWPDATYYEGDAGPEHPYTLEWSGEPGEVGRLEIEREGRTSRCGLLRMRDNRLRIRWGGVAGEFPDSMGDAYGNLAIFRREEDPQSVEGLLTPPERQRRPLVVHPELGPLRYDANLRWWDGVARFPGVRAQLHVDGPAEASAEHFDQPADLLPRLDIRAASSFAADELLELYNDNWRGERETIDRASFADRLTLESVGLSEDGTAQLYFGDGALFWGHTIIVLLDDTLVPVDAQIAG